MEFEPDAKQLGRFEHCMLSFYLSSFQKICSYHPYEIEFNLDVLVLEEKCEQ